MRKFAWNVGVFLDFIHIPAAIGVLALGDLWLPRELWVTIAGVTIILQVACLGCPLNIVTSWLRRFYDPSYEAYGSFTHYIYNRFGRKVGLAVFGVLLGTGVGIEYLFGVFGIGR